MTRHIASTARIPRPIGYIMELSGLAYITQGYSWGTGYTSILNYSLPGEKSYQFLIFVWATWLLIVAWRMNKTGNLVERAGLEAYR